MRGKFEGNRGVFNDFEFSPNEAIEKYCEEIQKNPLTLKDGLKNLHYSLK